MHYAINDVQQLDRVAKGSDIGPDMLERELDLLTRRSRQQIVEHEQHMDSRVFQQLIEQGWLLSLESLYQVAQALAVYCVDQAQHLHRLIAYLDNRMLLEELDQTVQPLGELVKGFTWHLIG